MKSVEFGADGSLSVKCETPDEMMVMDYFDKQIRDLRAEVARLEEKVGTMKTVFAGVLDSQGARISEMAEKSREGHQGEG